jgi:hypothetical protein
MYEKPDSKKELLDYLMFTLENYKPGFPSRCYPTTEMIEKIKKFKKKHGLKDENEQKDIPYHDREMGG